MKRQKKELKPEFDMLLPCGKFSTELDCDKSCLSNNDGTQLPCAKHQTVNFYPTFNASKDKTILDAIFDDEYLKRPNEYYISAVLVKDLDLDSIVQNYYGQFHNCHPFMPQKHEIWDYLDSIPHKYDLLLAMKLMGDGQTKTVYARDVETVNYLVNSILSYSRQVGKDLVSLQALLLAAMAAHISSLHDVSQSLRQCVVSLALEMELNLVDQAQVPDIFMDVNGFVTTRTKNTPKTVDTVDKLLLSPRTSQVPREILENTARRTLWELYFFDTLSGTASGQATSDLAIKKILTLYPKDIPQSVFDFKSRAECCKLVNDSIKLNVAIQDNQHYQKHLQHLKAAIGNWDLRIDDPDAYHSPYLVNSSGFVNEGVQQAVILVNYSKIFMHRPFSYLWRPDVSKHPDLSDGSKTKDAKSPEKQEADSRKIIETRRTIDSASSVVKLLLDTNPTKILDRTPFFACSLAFSCLVHLSAYSWVESSLTVLDDSSSELSSLRDSISSEELETYTEYIKLELGGIFQISRHWALSAKLVQHIKETLKKVSPKLFAKVQASIPESQNYVEVDSSEPSLDKMSTSTESSFPTAPSYDLPVTEIDFNEYEPDIVGMSLDPQDSDTGCDWVDRNVFEFEDFL
ncbi:hypothetical protein OGAPHI_005611 [Ogataea philodendri]|uniref:Transcription factor domain-containing protein n=1 Tax=Ogataea philodendri TaxID=1378263 RepID=A0A9P8T1P7_9ASCO|nr:uncharacterized protein OGAPHI_005611 [Ogataea philodendri]KAH3662359.1 hypothetical protein OGAPHI_005611 [Ogataea philodendri]